MIIPENNESLIEYSGVRACGSSRIQAAVFGKVFAAKKLREILQGENIYSLDFSAFLSRKRQKEFEEKFIELRSSESTNYFNNCKLSPTQWTKKPTQMGDPSLFARYNPGLTNVNNQSFTDQNGFDFNTVKIRNRNLQIGLQYAIIKCGKS